MDHNHVELAGNGTDLYHEVDNSFDDGDFASTFNDDYENYEEITRGDAGDPFQEDSDDDSFY